MVYWKYYHRCISPDSKSFGFVSLYFITVLHVFITVNCIPLSLLSLWNYLALAKMWQWYNQKIIMHLLCTHQFQSKKTKKLQQFLGIILCYLLSQCTLGCERLWNFKQKLIIEILVPDLPILAIQLFCAFCTNKYR